MRKDCFMKKIEFDTVYDEQATKFYKEIGNGKYERTIRVHRVEPTIGYIIGDCFKYCGIYYENDKHMTGYDYGDYEPPAFAQTKRIDFWEVATGFNEIVLVPKKQLDQEHYVTEFENDWDKWREENQHIW